MKRTINVHVCGFPSKIYGTVNGELRVWKENRDFIVLRESGRTVYHGSIGVRNTYAPVAFHVFFKGDKSPILPGTKHWDGKLTRYFECEEGCVVYHDAEEIIEFEQRGNK